MIRKIISWMLISISILVLASCTLFGNSTEGVYYHYDQGVKDEDSFLELKSNTWTDDTGLSGRYAITGNIIVFYAEILGEEAEFVSATIENGIITVDTGFSIVIYAKDGSMPERISEIEVTINDNRMEFKNDSYSMRIAENISQLEVTDLFELQSGVDYYLSYQSSGSAKITTQDISIQQTTTTLYVFFIDTFYNTVIKSYPLVIHRDISFTVEYRQINETVIQRETVKNGEKVKSIPSNIQTPTGYTFDTWGYYPTFFSDELVPINLSLHTVTSNLILYPIFKALSYNITLKTDDTTLNNQIIKVNYDSEFKLPIPEPKPGFKFVGWTYDDDVITDSQGFSINEFKYSQHINVEALFVEGQYLFSTYISHSNRGNIMNGYPYPEAFDYGQSITIRATANPGYTFDGWYEGDTLISTNAMYSFKMGSKDTVYEARFSAPTYNITYNLKGGEQHPLNVSSYDKDSTTISLYQPTRENYIFDGWSIEGITVTSIQTQNYLKNIEVVANWKPVAYQVSLFTDQVSSATISFHPNGGSGSIESRNITSTQPLTSIPTVTRSGYVFAGWYMNPEGTGQPFNFNQTITNDMMLYAKWTQYSSQYPTYNMTGNYIFSLSSYSTYRFNLVLGPNQRINLSERSYTSYYSFSIVNMNGSSVTSNSSGFNLVASTHGIGIYTVVVNVNSTNSYYSGYIDYTYSTDSVQTVASSVSTTTINYYQTKQLTVPVKKGYEFNGWFTERLGSGIKITDNSGYMIKPWEYGEQSLYAHFIKKPYTITYNLPTGATNHSSNITSYNSVTSTMTLSEPSRENYEFNGWYLDSSLKIPGNQILAGMWGNITFYPKFTPINYQIHYELNGGTGGTTLTNYNVLTNQSLGNPTKTGYNFTGWYTSSSGGEKVERISYGSSGNLTLYARYELANYTISYELNGGVNHNLNPLTVKYLDESKDLYPATKAHYTFVGWYKDRSFTTPVTSIATGQMSSMTLYAKFDPINYQITLQLNGGSGQTSLSYNIEQGQVLNPPEKTGYQFTGWYDATQTNVKVTSVPVGTTGNKTYYATYELITYTVTYNLNGGTNHASNPSNFKYTDSKYTLYQPTKAHYQFMGWYTNPQFTGNIVTAINQNSYENLTLYARFVPLTYVIEFDAQGGNNIANRNYTIESDQVNLPTPNKLGYKFVGWFDAVTNGNQYTVISKGSTGNLVLYARYELIQYGINYQLDGGKNNSSNPENYTYLTDTFTLLPATKENYTFDGWYVGQTKVTSIPKYSSSNYTLTARFIADSYTITFDSNGGSETPELIYSYGQYIVLNQTPTKTGYKFMGWYTEKVNGIKITELTSGQKGDLTLYARWDTLAYTITYNLNGGINHPDNKTEYGFSDNIITLLAPTKTGYTFMGWHKQSSFGDNPITSIQNGIENLTLHARFVKNIYQILLESEGEILYTVNYDVEKSTTITQKPTKAGYRFVGWFTEVQGGTPVTTIPVGSVGNVHLYARFELETYQLTYNLNGGTFSDSPKQSYTMLDTFILPEPNKLGYRFMGWYYQSNLLGTKATQIQVGTTSNTTLYASYQAITYQITYELYGGTNNGSNYSNYTVATSRSLYNPSKNGYEFLGWFDQVVDGNKITSIPLGKTGDIILHARFRPIDYSITYNLNSGILNEEDRIRTYTILDHVVLPIPTRLGYTFLGYYTSNSGGSRVTELLPGSTNNRTIYARWQKDVYSLTYQLNGGTNSISNRSTYDVDTQVTLYNPTKLGYTFDGWYLEETFENEILSIPTLSTGNKVLYAKFDPNPHHIVFVTNLGDLLDPITIYTDEEINLPVAYREYYSFMGWYEDEARTKLYNQQVMSPSAPETINLYAAWTLYNGENRSQTLTYYALPSNFKTEDIYQMMRLLGINYVDTDGQSFLYEFKETPNNIVAGDTISIEILATSKRNHITIGKILYPIYIDNIHIYGKPVINVDELLVDIDEISLESELTALSFGATAKDTFNESLEVFVEVRGVLEASSIIDIVIYTVDRVDQRTEYIIESVKVYGNPTITHDESIDGIKLTDIDSLETLLDIHATDSFDKPLNIDITIINEELIEIKAGTMISIEVTATDHFGHMSTYTIEDIHIYGTPTISFDELIKDLSENDFENIIDKLQLEALDSFSQELDIEISLMDDFVFEKGNIINLLVQTTDKLGQTQEIIIEDIRIHGTPIITFNEEASIKKSELNDMEAFYLRVGVLFDIEVKDDFGFDVPYDQVFAFDEEDSRIGKLIITATHSLGYLTNKELSFKIYDKDLITYQMTSDWLNVLSIYSKGEEFNLKAFDAFGEPITMIELIRTDLEPLLGGVTTNVSYKVTDVAGNEVIIPITNGIKLYDLPTITLKDPTMVSFNKGTQILSNWFIARDSFGLIVSSFEVIEGDISTPGNLSVKVTTIDIAGHKKEEVFTYLVLETYEITLIDGESVEKIILNEQEILTYILPTKEMNHYEFVGWFMEDELVQDIHNVKSNTTLNATYKALDYELSYQSDLLNKTTTFNILSEGKLAELEKEGYQFLGWIDGEETLYVNFEDLPLENIALTPLFEVIEYSITYLTDEETDTWEISFNITSEFDLPVIKKDGYDFIGWKEGNDDLYLNAKDLPLMNLELRPVFEVINYEITYMYVEDFDLSLAPKTFNVEVDQNLFIVSLDGYLFLGWEDLDGNIYQKTSALPLENITLKPHFELINFKISYIVDGFSLPLDALVQFNVESVSDLPIVEKEGYRFIGWSIEGDETIYNNTLDLPREDVRLSAEFEVIV